MVDIPMKVMGAVGKDSVMMINNVQSLHSVNAAHADAKPRQPVLHNHVQPDGPDMDIPQLKHAVGKGSKTALETQKKLAMIKACLGWNVKNPACDVGVSAFLLSGNRVISDDWFVFYGQPKSPDESVVLSSKDGTDREVISIDFAKIDHRVEKIVFVLTIHEALDKKLNFGMIKDAYIRIVDGKTNDELVGFMMDEYYENVISMMIGEVYKHNGLWKFNAVGNGVARDLAGLCGLYGVQVN